MARSTTFTFRINAEERQIISRLARQLRRSQSDSMRLLLREAFAQLTPTDSRETQTAVSKDE